MACSSEEAAAAVVIAGERRAAEQEQSNGMGGAANLNSLLCLAGVDSYIRPPCLPRGPVYKGDRAHLTCCTSTSTTSLRWVPVPLPLTPGPKRFFFGNKMHGPSSECLLNEPIRTLNEERSETTS
jgi:hypothetical protein